MSDTDPSRLSGDLIARKGDAGVQSFAAEPAVEDPSRRTSRPGPLAIVTGLILVIAASGYAGYRLGVDRVQDLRAGAAPIGGPRSPPAAPPAPLAKLAVPEWETLASRAMEPKTAMGPKGEGDAKMIAPHAGAPQAEVMAMADPAPDPPSSGRPPGGDDGPPADPAEAAATPEKPDTIHAPPSAPAGTWVDVTSALESLAAPAPDPGLARSTRTAAVQPPTPHRKPPLRIRAGAPGDKRYRIQVSALRSQAAARQEWRRLKRRHRGLLAGKRPLVIPVKKSAGADTVWRLQIAAFGSRPDARSFCRRARKERLACLIVRP